MSRPTSMPAAVVLVAIAAALSGCADPKAPSREAFAAALEPVVRDAFCRPIDVMRYEVKGGAGESSFPIVTSPKRGLAGPGSDGRSVAMLDGLAAVGLVTRTTFERPARWKGSEKAFVRQPLISYAPTPQGEPYIRAVDHRATDRMVSVPSICVARGEVVDVVRWSEPINLGDRRVSRTTYAYRGIDPIPVMPPAERAQLAEPKERTVPFELQSDGWRLMAR